MNKAQLVIDGSFGEGGGQILRTALALSLVTGRPFRIERIRARRAKPGLRAQHLAAVRAAAQIGCASLDGAEVGSQDVSFAPGAIRTGEHSFAVGTAGSATLVLQTVLPALLTAGQPSHLVLEGGTHNPLAPPVDFLARAFLPLVERMGPHVSLQLERHGFYPAGGGRCVATIEPVPALARLDLIERGAVRAVTARALVSRLPAGIAERELSVVARRLSLDAAACHAETIDDSPGPGNAVLVTVESEGVTEVFTAFGEKGLRAETVAENAAAQARDYLVAEVPVGPRLADQLLVPMALAGGGSFRTVEPTPHTRTNASVIQRFLDVSVRFSEQGRRAWRVDVVGRS
jgi:RNA 3'-terminal phosphate cyclase (ATP)